MRSASWSTKISISRHIELEHGSSEAMDTGRAAAPPLRVDGPIDRQMAERCE